MASALCDSMTNTTNPNRPTPALWYDYVLQCWICNGYIKPCGHPESMKPACCYAGRHANEHADPTHYEA
jgi:hypothetical protein